MKKILLLTIVSLSGIYVFAQGSDEDTKQDKFFAGGNFGLAFGRFTVINVNPQVGYRFNRYLGAGIGLNLLYASQKDKHPSTRQDLYKMVRGIAGMNTFVRFYPTQRFMVQVQPEGNYIFGKETFYQPQKQTYKLDAEIIPSVLVGGGMVTPTGRGAMLFTVMYDVMQNPASPYGNRPIVNVGYNFYF